MGLPEKPMLKTAINRCRTCGRIIPKRRKYHSRECRIQFAERLAFLVVTLRKIDARYASLVVSSGRIELAVMPWSGNHVSWFETDFDHEEEWQWAVFEFTLSLNEKWHRIRRKLRSERLATAEILSTNRTEQWRKSHFDLDLSGPTSEVSRDVHRALSALSIRAEDLKEGDFLRLLKQRFAEAAHASHPDRGAGDTKAFMRAKKARDTLVDQWEVGVLKAVLAGEEGVTRRGNPMPWSFFFDGYKRRWCYPD